MKNELLTCQNLRFTLNGERVPYLQNFSLEGSLKDPLIYFSGEQIVSEKIDNSKARKIVLDEEGKPVSIRLELKVPNQKVILKKIDIEDGFITFNLITISKGE